MNLNVKKTENVDLDDPNSESIQDSQLSHTNTRQQRKKKPLNSSHGYNIEVCPAQPSFNQKSINNKQPFNKNKFSKQRYTNSISLTKDDYILANYKFVVDSSYPIEAHYYAPDRRVDWNYVLAVVSQISQRTGPSQCPICLDEPQCPRLAECGHLYCWPCVVRYVRYVDWSNIGRNEESKYIQKSGSIPTKKCAICSEIIQLNCLKPVHFEYVSDYKLGEEICVELMRRVPTSCGDGCIALLPVDCSRARHMTVDASRFRMPHSNEIRGLLEADVKSLLLLSSANQDDPELLGVFNELHNQLLDQLEDLRCNNCDSKDDRKPMTTINSTCPVLSPEFVAIDYKDPFQEELLFEVLNKVSFTTPSSADSGSHSDDGNVYAGKSSGSQISVGSNHESAIGSMDLKGGDFDELNRSFLSKKSPNHYFFYQAEDFQPIYLHSLNWSCISLDYGQDTPSNWPKQIRGRILQLDTLHVTEDLRRRYRYLCHLPLFSCIQLVEIDIRPPLVSLFSLVHFRESFEWRHNQRLQIQRSDQRASAKQRRLEQQNTQEMLARLSRNVYANKRAGADFKDMIFNESDFLPLNCDPVSTESGSASNGLSSSSASKSVFSFASMAASKPKNSLVMDSIRPSPANNGSLLFSKAHGKDSRPLTLNEGSISNILDDEFSPPKTGFFLRAEDILVTKSRSRKKKS